MSLPRKGSRKISLESGAYRWLVRRDGSGFRLVAERHQDPGRRLVVQMPAAIFTSIPSIVSPALVRQCIELALEQGYDPSAVSGEHRVVVQRGQLDLSRVNTQDQLKRPVGRPRKRAVGEKRRPVYVSLDPVDRSRLEAAALARGLALGTLAREWILEHLAREPQRSSAAMR